MTKVCIEGEGGNSSLQKIAVVIVLRKLIRCMRVHTLRTADSAVSLSAPLTRLHLFGILSTSAGTLSFSHLQEGLELSECPDIDPRGLCSRLRWMSGLRVLTLEGEYQEA